MEKFTELSLYTQVVGRPPIFTEDGVTLTNPATGYAWRLQSNKCSNLCGWENGANSVNPQEFSMASDLSQFPTVFTMMKNLLAQSPTSFYMIGAFVRFSKASNALMAISSGRDTFTVEGVTPMRYDRYNTSKDGISFYQAFLQEMVRYF